jgi:cellulose biosynthesis protein BcsQ
MSIENKESKKKIITIASDKGGVGKSTLAALIVEYLNFKNIAVSLEDADPIRTSQTWVDNCLEDGRNVLSNNPRYLIIDTAGTSGAGLSWLQRANIVIAPFKPHYADTNTVLQWFYSIHPSLQQKIVFVPNQYQKTNEQKEGISKIEIAINDVGNGFLLPCISNRPAIYGPILQGSNTNFFVKHTDENVVNEIENLMNYILEK